MYSVSKLGLMELTTASTWTMSRERTLNIDGVSLSNLDDLLSGIQSADPDDRLVFIGKLAKVLQASRRGGFSERLTDEQQMDILEALLYTVSVRKSSSGTLYCLGLLDPGVSRDVIGKFLSTAELNLEAEEFHQLLFAVENVLDWMRVELGEEPSRKWYSTFDLSRVLEKARPFEDEEIQEALARLAFYSN